MGFNEISLVIFIVLAIFIFTPVNKIFKKFFNHRTDDFTKDSPGASGYFQNEDVISVGYATMPNGHKNPVEDVVGNGKILIKKFSPAMKNAIDGLTETVAR